MEAFELHLRQSGSIVDEGKIWYYVALEGMNFVDGECDKYLNELYVLDHGRDRFKSAIDSTGLLVNAILATDPTSKATMSIVTQAFGLTGKYADTFANSYLYSGHSSTVRHVVDQLQNEYRTKIVPSAIASEPEAYHSIRSYLELCLPPTIEAKIEKKITSEPAEPAAGPSGTAKGAEPAESRENQIAPAVSL